MESSVSDRPISDRPGLGKRLVLSAFGRDRLKGWLGAVGFDTTHWCRIVAYRTCKLWLSELAVSQMDVLEISGDYWSGLPAKSYRNVFFPGYDVCRAPLPDTFDLVIADQVFEHVDDPAAAVRNVRSMLRPGGYAMILAPFLLKVHGYPNDCSRWTERGMTNLLAANGFDAERVRSGSWGNRSCAVANLRHGWRMYGWGVGRSLRNNPTYPVMTWALAQA
jgi:hypothetical protein